MQLQVRLFPDTGHHYYFVPLTFDAVTDSAGFEDAYGIRLPALAADARQHLQREAAAGWRACALPGHTWLRYKFGTRKFARKGKFLEHADEGASAELLGLWLAIETNTGSRDRGFVREVIDNPRAGDQGYEEWKQAPENRKPTPYVAEVPSHLWDRPINQANDEPMKVDLVEACGLTHLLRGEPLQLEITWLPKRGEHVPVDIIIDFGNTRTIVLGFQRAGKLAQLDLLKTVCRPMLFGSEPEDAKRADYEKPQPSDLVAGSGFILCEPAFQTDSIPPEDLNQDTYKETTREWVETKKKLFGFVTQKEWRRETGLEQIVKRQPQMFVELSPAVIGENAMRILARADIDTLGTSFLSSPKRYAWDTDQVGGIQGEIANIGETYWLMQRHPSSLNREGVTLKGEMSLFLPVRPENRHYGDPRSAPPPLEWAEGVERPCYAPEAPTYPRSDSLIWTALSILESAYRQLNSEAWRKGDQAPLRRVLGDIIVTYPPGWTTEERDAYYNAWKYARNIFYWSRYPYRQEPPPEPPGVVMHIDEAVAAQLPILFADIRHLGNRGSGWIDLFGRSRQRDGIEATTVRVLSIDIGGGTTDTAIVEYTNRQEGDRDGAHLISSILLTDSSSIAGDKLLQLIIEGVLLPKMGERHAADENSRQKFANVLNGDGNYGLRLRRSVLTRAVFVPMVLRWLEDINLGRHGDPSTGTAWSPSRCARGSEGEMQGLIGALNKEFPQEILPFDAPFDVNYDGIKKIIRDWAQGIAEVHARYVAAFDCDLVVVTGKPSELRDLHDVFRDHLPIEFHRLVFAHGYHAGHWFPLSEDGIIKDAKMVTVTGATLFQAMEVGLVEGWSLKSGSQYRPPVRNYWGIVTARDGSAQRFAENGVFLDPSGSEEAEIELTPNTTIGRARFLQLVPEPVYKFRWRPGRFNGLARTMGLRARVRRVTRSEANGRELAVEYLQLVAVNGELEIGAEHRPATLEDVELKLHTLPANAHWLDAGQFVIDWRYA